MTVPTGNPMGLPEELPDVFDPAGEALVVPGTPIPIEQELQEEDKDAHYDSRTSEAIHRSRPENSPAVKAINMPM